MPYYISMNAKIDLTKEFKIFSPIKGADQIYTKTEAEGDISAAYKTLKEQKDYAPLFGLSKLKMSSNAITKLSQDFCWIRYSDATTKPPSKEEDFTKAKPDGDDKNIALITQAEYTNNIARHSTGTPIAKLEYLKNTASKQYSAIKKSAPVGEKNAEKLREGKKDAVSTALEITYTEKKSTYDNLLKEETEKWNAYIAKRNPYIAAKTSWLNSSKLLAPAYTSMEKAYNAIPKEKRDRVAPLLLKFKREPKQQIN